MLQFSALTSPHAAGDSLCLGFQDWRSGDCSLLSEHPSHILSLLHASVSPKGKQSIKIPVPSHRVMEKEM